MPVQVLIQSTKDGYKATCSMFGFTVEAKTKEEASQQINAMIKDHTEKLKAEGKIPLPKDRNSCTPMPNTACKTTDCSGCKK